MNELLFENYMVPKVTYGIDGLFSLYKNQPNFAKDKSTAMVISLGFHSIHFMPVVNGKIEAENMRRLNVGGFHLTNFLHRGLQLKYNANSANITIGRAEEVLVDHCYVAKDFGPELRLWSDVDYYQKNVHKMQLPFTVGKSYCFVFLNQGSSSKGRLKRISNQTITKGKSPEVPFHGITSSYNYFEVI